MPKHKDYIHIGTIEPKWEKIPKKWTNDDKEEVLAFLIGAFSKYNEKNEDEYTDMNKDLCEYTRKVLKLTESEQRIASILTEELKKSDVLDIIKKDKDFEKRVKKIISDALEEFFRVMYQHGSIFKNLVR